MDTFKDGVLINKRYQLLNYLGNGGMGTVYQAYDRYNQQVVALKVIAMQTAKEQVLDAGQADLRLLLAEEFRTLSSLKHPNIISVLDYGFDEQKQPFYTMELLENPQTILAASEGKTDSERLQLLAQTLHALDFLHRRGIIHRDLKPENILVSDGIVRILDFGLAIDRFSAEKEKNLAGTILYLSPELMSGGYPSFASDMYAFGVIAYEIFMGKHPFSYEHIAQFIMNTLNQKPVFDNPDLDPKLAHIICTLLAKQPEERYQNVRELLMELLEIDNSLVIYDSKHVQESFLQNAAFTGRETELEQLLDAVKCTVRSEGAAWLISGESGIGKSRLMDELRTHALVDGLHVLRGQATAETGHPYALWISIFRHLLLLAEPDDREAAVFKAMLPDIEKLLERKIPQLSRLHPTAERNRFTETVKNLVAKIDRPCLIVLEDLHWANQESLELLQMLMRQTADTNLMIVGSYRADEVTGLLLKLKGAKTINLKRLSYESIEHLSMAMIGNIVRESKVIQLLEQESEGNVYFLIEIIRALAEESGHLQAINAVDLPSRVLTGGMLEHLRRRLGRISTKNLEILELAAVAGRYIDAGILTSYWDNESIVLFLEDCVNALILEFFEGDWRFAHDKLRETILDDMPQKKKQSNHRQIALALEALKGEYAANALVYHWESSDDAERSAYWANIAGGSALHIGAYHDAVNYLTKAVTHHNGYRLQRRLGQAYYGLGDLRVASQHLVLALEQLGQRVPKRFALSILKEGVRSFLNYRGWFLKRSSNPEETLEAARIYGILGEITYFTLETTLGVYSVLKMFNLASRADDSPELAQAHLNMCIVMSFIPDYGLAEYYGDEALRIARAVNDTNSLMRILVRYAVYFTGVGKWDRATAALDEALDIANRVGDMREANESNSTRAVMLHYQGKIEDAVAYNTVTEELAQRLGNQQQRGWGIYSRAENLNNLGQYEAAKLLLDKVMYVLDEEGYTVSKLRILGALAQVHLNMGEPEKALKAIERARKVLGKKAPNVAALLETYASFGGLYLSLMEAGQASPSDEGMLENAKLGIRLLKRYTRLYPIGKPRYYLWLGRLEALLGQKDKAKQLYERALVESRELEMIYDEGLVRQYLEALPA